MEMSTLSATLCTVQMLISANYYIVTLLCELTIIVLLVIVSGVTLELAPAYLVKYEQTVKTIKSPRKMWRLILSITSRAMSRTMRLPIRRSNHMMNKINECKANNTLNSVDDISNQHLITNTAKIDKTIPDEELEYYEEWQEEEKKDLSNSNKTDNEDAVVCEIIDDVKKSESMNLEKATQKHKANNQDNVNCADLSNSLSLHADTNTHTKQNKHQVKNGILHNTLDNFFDMERLLDEALTESIVRSAQVNQCNNNNNSNSNDADDNIDNDNLSTEKKNSTRKSNYNNLSEIGKSTKENTDINFEDDMLRQMASPFASRPRHRNFSNLNSQQ